jgi:hypothetical protein
MAAAANFSLGFAAVWTLRPLPRPRPPARAQPPTRSLSKSITMLFIRIWRSMRRRGNPRGPRSAATRHRRSTNSSEVIIGAW